MSIKNGFYCPDKILTMLDINGKKPMYRLIVGNRTGGKSFAMKRMLLRKFVKDGTKFIYLTRYQKHLSGIAANFISDIKQVDPQFKDSNMSEEVVGKDLYLSLYLDGKHCGYGLALNGYETIRRYSSTFVDAQYILFDEFQTSDNKYLSKEITKFISVCISVARGEGKHTRDIDVFLVGNTYSTLNPYYLAMGINKRLRADTKYLRGDGWVMEQMYNPDASAALDESPIGRAFQGQRELDSSSRNEYIFDDSNFIERVAGPKYTRFNITRDGVTYGAWYTQPGYLYIATHHDPRQKINFVMNTKDHTVGTTLLVNTNTYIKVLKKNYQDGLCRFETPECRDVFLELLGFLVASK